MTYSTLTPHFAISPIWKRRSYNYRRYPLAMTLQNGFPTPNPHPRVGSVRAQGRQKADPGAEQGLKVSRRLRWEW